MALPVEPFTQAPKQEDYEENVKKWDAFLAQLTSAGPANSLITAGLAGLQDRQPGESNLSHGAKAVAAGLSSYEQGKRKEFEDKQTMAESARKERQVGVQEGQLGVQQGQLGVQEEQLGETIRSNQEQEKIAWARIASNDRYYASIAAQASAKAGGQLGWDDAYNIAQSSIDAQLEQLSMAMETVDPNTPAYGQLANELLRIQQNYNQLVHQRATGYVQSSRGGNPVAPLSPAAVAQIRNSPEYKADPTGMENKLRMRQRDAYEPPAGASAPAGPAAAPAGPQPTPTENTVPVAPPEPELSGTRRKENREAWGNENAIAKSEFTNEVPNMSTEQLRVWFKENSKYLSLQEQKIVRDLLGAKASGRNR